jgi:hypothetical protein
MRPDVHLPAVPLFALDATTFALGSVRPSVNLPLDLPHTAGGAVPLHQPIIAIAPEALTIVKLLFAGRCVSVEALSFVTATKPSSSEISTSAMSEPSRSSFMVIPGVRSVPPYLVLA